MPLSAGHALNVVDASLGTAALVATVTPLRCRLMTTNGTSTTNGTELATGGGYTAGTGAPGVTFAGTAVVAPNAQAGSNVAVSVTNMPTATIVGVELWDSAVTPVRKWWGALTASKTVAAGDTFSIPAGSLTAAVGV